MWQKTIWPQVLLFPQNMNCVFRFPESIFNQRNWMKKHGVLAVVITFNLCNTQKQNDETNHKTQRLLKLSKLFVTYAVETIMSFGQFSFEAKDSTKRFFLRSSKSADCRISDRVGKPFGQKTNWGHLFLKI